MESFLTALCIWISIFKTIFLITSANIIKYNSTDKA